MKRTLHVRFGISEVHHAKLHSSAATITSIAPDVLAVQEVGVPGALAEVGELDGRCTPNSPSSTVAASASASAPGTRRTDLAQVTDFPEQLPEPR